jgi:hypothetical protein
MTDRENSAAEDAFFASLGPSRPPPGRPKKASSMTFENPANGYTETVSNPGLWTFLFGGFYLASKGAWAQALCAFGAAVFTCGLSWLVYPVFAERIVESAYLRNGWRRI